MKYALILMTLILFGCSNNNSSLPLPDVNSIITLPPSGSAPYLAWNTAGDLLWLDKDLNLINDKKLDGYSLQQVELLDDGLLLLAEVIKNDQIVDQLIKLSFSGEQLAKWSELPNSVDSLTISQNNLSFIAFMGDEFQLNRDSIVATGKNYGWKASIIMLDSGDRIICNAGDSSRPSKCIKEGKQGWIKEGPWGTYPKLCAGYLVEDTYYKPESSYDNLQVTIRDTTSGEIIGEIALLEVNSTRCINDQLFTIGKTINIYPLPQLEPTSVTQCTGGKAKDMTVSATEMVCINESGKLFSQSLE